MWTDFKGANYGYGFTVVQSPGGKAVGHSGGFDGINSQLDIYVDSGYIVAAMAIPTTAPRPWPTGSARSWPG